MKQPIGRNLRGSRASGASERKRAAQNDALAGRKWCRDRKWANLQAARVAGEIRYFLVVFPLLLMVSRRTTLRSIELRAYCEEGEINAHFRADLALMEQAE